MTIQPVILAGGAGTRLWPLSRRSYPKQFLALVTERSLLQDTINRLEGLGSVAAPLLVCNEEHRFLVAEQTRQLGVKPSSIILEPEGRNTAPALTLAALTLEDRSRDVDSESPVMLVMPSDHVIKDMDAFRSVVESGAALAETGCLVAVGIVPRSPNTGYGYIRKGEILDSRLPDTVGGTGGRGTNAFSGAPPLRVAGFVEKPDRATAEQMLKTDEYLWNSGIFLVQASVWLDQLRRHRPDVAEACAAAHVRGQRDGDFFRPDAKLFASCPGDFVAYSIMEKVTKGHTQKGSESSLMSVPDGINARCPDCVVIPLDAGWSDVGDWPSLWDETEKDVDGNAIKGDVDARSMRNSLLMAQHVRVVAEGLENVIVVGTADAVLVAHKDLGRDSDALVEKLEAESGTEDEGYGKVERPWGRYELVDSGPHSQVRLLTLNPGAALSSHLHRHRTEHWVVLKGAAKVTRGDEKFTLTENQSTNVPIDTWHRLENPGSSPLELIEVRSGSYLGEDDIARDKDSR